LRRAAVLLIVGVASTVLAIPQASAAGHPHVPPGAAWGSHNISSRIPVPPTAVTQPWHLAWRAETAFPARTTSALTCRIAAQLTAAGDHVRAEFTSPVTPGTGYTISSASIAPAVGSELTVDAAKSVPLTFGGTASVVVRAGASVLSDAVPMFVGPGATLDVTVTVPAGDAANAETAAGTAACANGVVTDAATAPASAFTTRTGARWLQSVQVSGPVQRAVVAFGDSITAGPAPGARWSDVLSHYDTAVANAGVSGGLLTRLGPLNSVPGITRATAVLSEPNLSDLVLLIGTNDVFAGVTSTQLLNAFSGVMAQAKAKHVQVWICTILPRNGSLRWTAAMNNTRHAVNTAFRSSWLTSRGAKLIDTDAALRNPASPETLRPQWDLGDHTHPNAAGEQQIGMAVARALRLS
jgi:lysophospholipase L1-like esterase